MSRKSIFIIRRPDILYQNWRLLKYFTICKPTYSLNVMYFWVKLRKTSQLFILSIRNWWDPEKLLCNECQNGARLNVRLLKQCQSYLANSQHKWHQTKKKMFQNRASHYFWLKATNNICNHSQQDQEECK